MTPPLTYMRWKPGTARLGRFSPPLDYRHPHLHLLCPLCGAQLGDEPGATSGVIVFAVGPDDDQALRQHRDGKWYAAVATVLHLACANELPVDQHEELARRLERELMPR